MRYDGKDSRQPWKTFASISKTFLFLGLHNQIFGVWCLICFVLFMFSLVFSWFGVDTIIVLLQNIYRLQQLLIVGAQEVVRVLKNGKFKDFKGGVQQERNTQRLANFTTSPHQPTSILTLDSCLVLCVLYSLLHVCNYVNTHCLPIQRLK